MSIKIENTEVVGWNAALRGMRNPYNSWGKADSYWTHIEDPETLETAPFQFFVGEADKDLARRLVKAGTDHSKFMRMIVVYADITAPLYWFKEYDTYKVGTVANSCSTMHKIYSKEFTLDDFSIEHLLDPEGLFADIITDLNSWRKDYLRTRTKDKEFWWQMIQLLPSSYNQRRTVMLNYAVLRNMYHARRDHKLDEWRDFCKWIETLPYSDLITMDGD